MKPILIIQSGQCSQARTRLRQPIEFILWTYLQASSPVPRLVRFVNSLKQCVPLCALVLTCIAVDSPAQTASVPAQDEFPGVVRLAAVQRLSPAGNTSFVGNSTSIIELTAETKPASDALVITTNVGSGIVYTCDPTVNAVAGVCNYLNTTLKGLYAGRFINANANIYIAFGATGLGQSETSLSGLSYSSFRTALIATQSSADDAMAISDSVPAANPFGTDQVATTNPNTRVLGFTPTGGLTPAGAGCSLGAAGCYDGIITISSSVLSSGGLYFRNGSITSNQYDFYTVVEHETDEVLGTSSFGFGGFTSGGHTYVAPSDLFRYHSNGARSLVAGTTNSCASSNTTNACFSLDGVNMLQQYNNLNNGDDAGDWAPNCAMPRVQNATGCPGVANVDISPTAEILVLDVVGYTLGRTSKVGIFRSSAFMTAEDVNGNIAWDPGTDKAFFFGSPGDILIQGDWDGSGKTKLGIFRPGVAMFALDMNGNGVWDPGIDKFGFFGQAGDVPIVGDWTGDGKSKIGIYRPSTQLFALDFNNNLSYDAGTDKIGHFGALGDQPILGDWTGDGITKIGIYRPSASLFALDVNNNLTWDSGIDKANVFGVPGDTPVVGDWTGDHITKVGIYRASVSLWALDINNNLAWDAGTDKAGVFGASGDVPLVGDWDGTGVSRVGIFRPSVQLWGLDKNGNLAWDAGIDLSGVFGGSGDTPLIGKW